MPLQHRFRVRQSPPNAAVASRRRSASPDRPVSTSSPPAAESNETTPGTRRNVPSCDRCRRFKKKCSRTFPTCSLCAAAGQKCSFAIPNVPSTAVQTRHLQARIEWLSGLINRGITLPAGTGSIESVDTGTVLNLLPLPPNPPPQANAQTHLQGPDPDASLAVADATNVTTADTVYENGDSSKAVGEGRNLEITERSRPPCTSGTSRDRQSLAIILASESPSSGPATSPYSDTNAVAGLAPVTNGLTPASFARQCVDAYFRHVHRAYPSIDMTEMYLNVQVIDSWDMLRTPKTSGPTLLLYLVMAIGCTTLQRAGKLPKGDAFSFFEISYDTIVQECLCTEKDEKKSLQTLVLVALYSLFDPRGMCAWTMAGIASRQAVLRGLSRKTTSESDSESAAEVEKRRRLFWSIWVLDRMMAFSLGLPVALIDEGQDVPLPGLTVEEFGSMERQYHASMLQTNRHIIQLRHLEDLILRQVLLRKASDVAAMSQPDCRSLNQSIRADIENWYSNGCLASPVEADSVPTHSSISWLSTRYYHLLLFLHYPCPLNAKGLGMSSRELLLPLIQKCLQLTSVLLQQKQLPLNRVTLCRIFPVGLLLLQCLLQADVATQMTFSHDSIGIIVDVLAAFPQEWTQARQAAAIFRQSLQATTSLTALTREKPYPSALQQLSGLYGSPYSSSPCAQAESPHAPLLRSSITNLTSLMRKVLGSASCFIFHDLPASGTAFPGPPGNQLLGPFSLDTTILPLATANATASEASIDEGTWQFMDPAFF